MTDGEERHKVFVYGTLLSDDSEPNRYQKKVKLFSSRRAAVKGQLYIHGVPYIVLGGDDLTHGKVFELDGSTLVEYDDIEGVGRVGGPWTYLRERVMAKYEDGSEEEVWIYCKAEYNCGDHKTNGQFEDWMDKGLYPIPEILFCDRE